MREIKIRVADQDDARKLAQRLRAAAARKIDRELKERGWRPWSDKEQVDRYKTARTAFEQGVGPIEAVHEAITPAVAAHIAEQERLEAERHHEELLAKLARRHRRSRPLETAGVIIGSIAIGYAVIVLIIIIFACLITGTPIG